MALTLTRKCGEAVRLRVPGLDEPITVVISHIRPGAVKLKLTAAREVEIERPELDGKKAPRRKGVSDG